MSKNKKKGLFIVFEGLDGAGQDTQIALLKDFLLSKKQKIYQTSEPSHNLIGGLIRSLLRSHWKMSNTGIQLLYCADRAHHLESEVTPVLDKNTHVICGRYIFSTIAFGSLDNDMEWLESLNRSFRQPDITIFLDVKPEECIRRINNSRPSKEIFEKIAKLKVVYKTYQKLISNKKYKNVFSVDGARDKEVVALDIQKIVTQYL
jgi:dTMP kinase